MKKTLILTAAAIPTGVIVGAVDAPFGRCCPLPSPRSAPAQLRGALGLEKFEFAAAYVVNGNRSIYSGQRA